MTKRVGYLTCFVGVIIVASFLAARHFSPALPSSAAHISFLLDWKAGMEYAGFFVAQEKGFYKEVGLDVEIIDGSGATVSVKLIAEGKYSLGMATGDAIAIGVEKGMPIRSIAVLFQQSPVVIYSLKSSGIVSPKDLIGKRIGVSTGDTKYNYFQAFESRIGVKPGDIKEVTVGWEVAPLLTQQVDALLGYINNQPVQVEMQGAPVNIIKLRDFGLNLYNEAIVGNRRFLDENNATVKRFVAASIRGWQYAIEHPREAVSIVAARHPEQDARYLLRNFEEIIPLTESADTVASGFGAQSIQGWKNTIQILREVSLLKSNLDPNSVFTDAFMPKR